MYTQLFCDQYTKNDLKQLFLFTPSKTAPYPPTLSSLNGILTCCSYQKLNLPHRKTNQALRALSYVGPTLWNKLNKSLKTFVSLNAFKQHKELLFQER